MMSACLAALTLAQAAPAAPDVGRKPSEVLMPSRPEMRQDFERYGFAEAVIDGDHVYLSGVVAGLVPGEADPSIGYERAFRYIGRTLERAGSSWDGVVEMTTFHTDLPAQIDAFTAVKHKYVKAPFPAWTAIDVDRLLPDNGLVEIKVVARRSAAVAK